MPFGEPFNQYYSKVLKPALFKISFNVLRADEIYTNRAIVDDIIEQIIVSDIIIADVSNKNPNVNYELGIAHALRKQVIIISQQVEDIPFDYRHIRSILYNTADANWEKELETRIQETIMKILDTQFDKFEIASLAKFYDRLLSDKLLGLKRVFNSRQKMNIFLDELWRKPISRLDIIAFGLKSFRDSMTKMVTNQVKNGMKIRLLTMNPNSEFIKQREIDEKLTNGSIRKTIIDLSTWREEINDKSGLNRSVQIKCYNALPLDFYWRQDDEVFVGPYLNGVGSQQTLAYHFSKDSDLGRFYFDYFNRLWKDKSFSKKLKFS